MRSQVAASPPSEPLRGAVPALLRFTQFYARLHSSVTLLVDYRTYE